MNTRKKYGIIIGLIIVTILSAIIGVTLGAAEISATQTFKILFHSLGNKSGYHGTHIPDSLISIILYIRLPRILIALCSGAALSVCGAALQSIFRNPLADPYVLGVSSGASLGATIAIISGIAATAGITLIAFAGAVTTSVVIYMTTIYKNHINQNTLLLTGVALSMMMISLVSLLMALNRVHLETIIFWTMGGMNAASWDIISYVLPLIILGVLTLQFYAKTLNILSFGNDAAQSLGINVKQNLLIVLFICAALIAIIVSNTGTIGFVGLIIPHVSRKIIGPNNQYVIPVSALTGAWFMLVCDTLARTIIAPAELPVGCITAIIGSPYFLWILLKKEKHSR